MNEICTVEFAQCLRKANDERSLGYVVMTDVVTYASFLAIIAPIIGLFDNFLGPFGLWSPVLQNVGFLLNGIIIFYILMRDHITRSR